MTAIKPRTARVVIYQGDDLARLSSLDDKVTRTEAMLRQAERRAKTARTTGARTLDDDAPEENRVLELTIELEDAVTTRDAFAAEAEERGVAVVINALPRKTWRDLQNDHPGRPDHADDSRFGNLNTDTLPEVLLPKMVDIEASSVDGDLGEFLESLSGHDYYERLFLTAVALNVGGATADPTLRLGSVLSQISTETSN